MIVTLFAHNIQLNILHQIPLAQNKISDIEWIVCLKAHRSKFLDL